MKRKTLSGLDPEVVRIAPSILAADFARLGEDIRAIEAGGAEVVHIDVMDGHFVPNISMGPPVVRAIRPVSGLPFDVHLMLTRPDLYVRPFVDAGADHITIHAESEGDLRAVLEEILGLGCSCGMVLKPATPASALAPYLDLLDLILVMTVEPGFGGQSFMADQLPKLRRLREMIAESGRPIHLQVDGGISGDTVQCAVDAGARMLVAGSSVFRHPAGVAAGLSALRCRPA